MQILGDTRHCPRFDRCLSVSLVAFQWVIIKNAQYLQLINFLQKSQNKNFFCRIDPWRSRVLTKRTKSWSARDVENQIPFLEISIFFPIICLSSMSGKAVPGRSETALPDKKHRYFYRNEKKSNLNDKFGKIILNLNLEIWKKFRVKIISQQQYIKTL